MFKICLYMSIINLVLIMSHCVIFTKLLDVKDNVLDVEFLKISHKLQLVQS